jgi:hypothetical protein
MSAFTVTERVLSERFEGSDPFYFESMMERLESCENPWEIISDLWLGNFDSQGREMLAEEYGYTEEEFDLFLRVVRSIYNVM